MRILINNEEVVCSNELTIKEEMLNTSSTILNNCYPLSWETTKDYTQYYYPEDYSKCLIYGEKTEIEFEIDGNTTQNGTPTPTNPVPIINKTGQILETINDRQYLFNLGNIELCKIDTYQDKIKKSTGKNLFKTPTTFPQSLNGINITRNNDGSITLDGTCTASGGVYIDLDEPIILDGQYTYSIKTVGTISTNGQFMVSLRESNNTSVGLNPTVGTNQIRQVSKTLNTTATKIQFYCNPNITLHCTIYLQLEKGETATEYEPYGKVWYIHKEIGKIVLNGTETITVSNSGTSNWYYKITTNNPTANQLGELCSHYSNAGIYNSNTTQGILLITNGTEIRIRYGTQDTVPNFKTWLSNNNVTLYYPLATPTNTVITDINLINQLNGVNENLLFCGIVKRTGNINLNPRQFHGCDLQVLDFKDFLSQGETLDFVIKDKTVLQAIEQVINAISNYGVILGNVNINGADNEIGAYSTAEKTAYDVFNYLADITQSRWTTRMINENIIAVDFYDPDEMPGGTTLDYTQQFFKDKNIVDISYNYSTADYRNKQVMLSNEIYADINYTDTILADGYTKTYSLENNIYNLASVIINGVYLTIATKEEQVLGIEADVYYETGKNTIEFNNLYTAGTSITIVYTPLVKGRQVVYNDSEVNRIENNINRKGVIARYENRNDALSSDELIAIGNSYIRYKGTAEIILTVQTQNNDLWNVGQKVTATNIPLNQLNTEYMVKSKEINMILTTGDIFYIYTLSSSFNSETEINYFDNQRAKASGNIKSGDFIDRNIDIETSTNIIYNNLNIQEKQVDGDNILNSILNSPFIE